MSEKDESCSIDSSSNHPSDLEDSLKLLIKRDNPMANAAKKALERL